jgi:hypothetical protein
MKYIYIWLASSFLLLASCEDKTHEGDCGCGSKNYTTIKNVRVSYAHGGINTFADDNRLVNSYTLCTGLDTLAESADALVPDYILSGEMRIPCFIGPTLLPSQALLKVTAISKIP